MKKGRMFGACVLAGVMCVVSSCSRAPEIPTAPQSVLNVGFYAYFAPMSYSADSDPAADGFNIHLGYEADLLTAIEVMDVGLSFSRKGIAEWPGIWLKAAEPGYDLIGGGITILDSRTQDATGTQRVAFTSGHITFRQSLLIRAEDADRLSTYASLTRDVKIGVLRGTTGEARLLQITGIVDANGIVTKGTRIDTPQGTLIADGTADYKITAAASTPNVENRFTLYPPAANMPQINYPVNMPHQGFDPLVPRVLIALSDEQVLFENLRERRIDAIARGEIGNRDAAAAAHGAFVVTALDEQVEYGGFTLAAEDVALRASLDAQIDYLTDGGNIGYAEWLADPQVFLKRAQVRSTNEQ
ncbi:MAG: transporter substrate-binding domain-containing protein [Candidatus Poribacteria bacterium]|nr:transporter substrate-binding domain-containing protein [Candidatus Poribacteria bacterium]